ncbi:MAG: V-type ATP synthase subunit A, partial [Bacilli bacterium]
SIDKQYGMLDLIVSWYEHANSALSRGVEYRQMENLAVNERIGHIKYVGEDKFKEEAKALKHDLIAAFSELKEE